MTYFKNIETLENLKKAYRKLSLKHHPDCGGSEEEMKIINNEYELLFKKLQDAKSTDQKSDTNKEQSHDFINIINELIKFKNVDIEIVGSWIWLSGETYAIKEEIKKLGFNWSKNRKKWYKGEMSNKKKKGSNLSFEQMRNLYGSKKVATKSKSQYAISL